MGADPNASYLGRIKATRGFVGAIVAALSLLVFAAVPALAVHEADFLELDGDATNGADPGDDWDNVCKQVTITNDTTSTIPDQCASAANTTGATAVSWTSEPNPSASIFTGGGSKDPIDVSSWAWKDAGGLPDKDNLLHSFAARYSSAPSATCPAGTATTCDILYFGSDRYDNSGDAQQGFWFFQNKITLGSVKSGGGFNFNGVHRAGDLLIISNFSNGGTTSTISVYVWDPTVSGNLDLLATSDAANCGVVTGNDQFCGIVNDENITMPWSFTDKSGTPNNGALNGEFYEGGVNLSTLGLSNECFSSVASETRSSTSTTATLKDFVLGQFATCAGGMTTQASNTGTVTPGTSITDTATITITGAQNPADPTGTVDFFLCSGTCTSSTSGGTQVGSAVTLVGGTNTTDGIATATSAAVNTAGSPLAPGRYCFRAVWGGDSNYAGTSHTNATTECFTVKDTSTTTTAQTWVPNDTATVSTAGGTAVSGKVTFTLYPGTGCTGTPLGSWEDTTAPFASSNPGTGTGGVTINATGTTSVSWLAVFTPTDANAVQGSTAVCETSTLTIDNDGP